MKLILCFVLSLAFGSAHAEGAFTTGTFIDPAFLPKHLGITEQQMGQLEFMHSMGEMSLAEIQYYRDLYAKSKQPITVQTPAGTVIVDPNNPKNQMLMPNPK